MTTQTLIGNYLNCVFNETGLQQITVANKYPIISHGGLSLNYPTPILNSSITATSKNVFVTHVYDTVTVYFTYSIYNHDVTVNIKISNLGSASFSNPSFSFPTFNFSRNASGNMHSWHPSYLAYCGLSIYHPGLFTPLCASYAYDDNFAICLHTKTHFNLPTLVNANWLTDGIIPAQCTPNFFFSDTIMAHTSVNFDVILRTIDSTDLTKIIGAYVIDYNTIVGPLQYTPNDLPVIACYPEDETWVTPDSPLGLHSARRLDTPDGISAFETMITPSIGVSQGTIFWQPQGWNPRGGQYRPDFDCWPTTIQQNLPILVNWCKSNNLSFGLCARAAQFISPLSYTQDGVYDIDYRNQSQLNMLWTRFQNVITLGVNSFYLDTFGVDLNSYYIMKFLRNLMGTTILTYSEYTSDLLLPYSGVYSQLMDNYGNTRWYSSEIMKIFRLLQPKCSILTGSVLPPDPITNLPSTPIDVYGQLKLSPIIPDFQSGNAKTQLQYLINTYMNGNNWK